MRKVEGLAIKYVGYNNPESADEVDLELLGLRTAIAAAEQRIAVLKQSLKLQLLMKDAVVEEPADEETVTETTEVKTAE